MQVVVVIWALTGLCASNVVGFMPGLPMLGQESNEPQFLTCNNVELLDNGTPLFAFAVTVSDKSDSSLDLSPMGMFGWWNPMMDHGRSKSSLSAKIEILTTGLTGTGLVAFTTRSQPENGCALDGRADFGTNLRGTVSDSSAHGLGLHGFHNMGFGMHGFGNPMGMGNDFGLAGDDGVIAQLPITAGRVSSLTVDGLPFNSLRDLAGRGVVICSSVSDEFGNEPVCERPFFACCSLNYDGRERNLLDN